MEEWKDIPNYENLYQASTLGKIRSLDRTINGRWGKTTLKGKILKQAYDKDKYLLVNLCKNGKSKNQSVHRLIAQTFIPNPHRYSQINHIDKNKNNNNVENLEWCTPQYNVFYSKAKKIKQIDKDGNIVKIWDGICEIEKELKISNITRCCKKKSKTAGGYIWEYLL